VVLADGVVLGAAGAAAGVAVGVAVAWFGRPVSERYVFQAYAGGFRVFPAALLAICAAAVLTGVLAALVPAATAARQPVVAGLTGRRGAVRSRRRWLVLGLVMIAGGGVLAAAAAWQSSLGLIVLGLAVGEVGLVLCTPSLLGAIGMLAHRLPLSARMAVRDTARNRSSAAPAISAVMAAVAGSVAIGVILASADARGDADHEPLLPDGTVAVAVGSGTATDGSAPIDAVIRATRTVLATDHSLTVGQAACPPGTASDLFCVLEPVLPAARRCPFVGQGLDSDLTDAQRRAASADRRCDDPFGASPMFPAAVGDGAALAALTGASGTDLAAASDVLAGGGVVTTDGRYVVDGRITLDVQTRRDDSDVVSHRPATFPAYVLSGRIAALVVSPSVVTTAGLTTEPYAVLTRPATMPDEAARQRLDAALRAIGPDVYGIVDQGPSSGNDPTLLLLAIGAGLITLGAAAVATGLAAVDGRNDLATLGAIGASPRMRRLLSVSQAGVIAGLGTVLGLGAGFAAAYTILVAMNQGLRGAERWPRELPYPPTVPWSDLAVLLVVPLVAMLGAGLLTRSRLPIERRPG
jgi:putative ABC transport system permease protein